MGAKLRSFQKESSHGSYAQQRKRYQPSVAALQAHPSLLGEAVRCRYREGDLQHGQEGLLPFSIGVVLRDSHGIPQVKMIAGNKIVRILRAQGLAPTLPEDLHCLIK